jgi:hypothetical protein
MTRMLGLLCFLAGGALTGGVVYAVMLRRAQQRLIWSEKDGWHTIARVYSNL